MSVREYVGARYVPKFADPIEWDNTLSYEPLTVVTNQGSSYVSRQSVPTGIDITNENYWILWADYNAQIEAYRREVQTFNSRIEAMEEGLPVADFNENNTVKDSINDIKSIIPASNFTDVNTVKKYIDDKSTDVTTYVNTTKTELTEMLTGNICNVTDIVDYVTVPYDAATTNHQIVCLAYDQTNDAMYIANRYQNDTKTLLRKLSNFSSYAVGATATPTQSLVIDAVHPNAMSVSNGKLYVIDYDSTPTVFVVELENFSLQTTTDFGYKLRTGCVKDDVWYVQPLTANLLYKFCFCKDHPFTSSRAFGIKMPLNSNYAYIQDCDVHQNAFVRMCSMLDSINSNPYLEINSSEMDKYPIIIPITHKQDREWEGVTFSDTYCYINYANIICRSQQIKNIKPATGSAAETKTHMWQSSDVGYCFNLPKQQEGVIADFDSSTNTYTIKIPYRIAFAIWNSAYAESPNLLLHFELVGTSQQTRRGGNTLIPLQGLNTAIRNHSCWGNLSTGLWCLTFEVNRTDFSSDNDIVISIRLNTYTELNCTANQNVTCAVRETVNPIIENPTFRIIR